MKTIKVTVEHYIEVPDNAEILTFDLEDFPQSHVVKMWGQLYRPDLAWMKYTTREMNKTRFSQPEMQSPSFETVSTDEWEMFQGEYEYTWKMVEEAVAPGA